MTFKAKARGLIGAASGQALDAVRSDAHRLAQEVQRATADDVAALRNEVASLRDEAQARRGEIEQLRGTIDLIAGQLQDQASVGEARAEALGHLKRHVDEGSEGAEALRLRVSALAEQLRWESDELRKAVSAILLRVEGRGGAG